MIAILNVEIRKLNGSLAAVLAIVAPALPGVLATLSLMTSDHTARWPSIFNERGRARRLLTTRIRRFSSRWVCRLTPIAVGWATRQRPVASRLFAANYGSCSAAGRRVGVACPEASRRSAAAKTICFLGSASSDR